MTDAPRTAVRDAILAGVRSDLSHDEVETLEDVCLSATEAACLDSHALVDWSEYREVAL